MDHAATTPVHEEVILTMAESYRNLFGNPSSIHSFGREARRQLDEARRMVAGFIQADEREIIFTSGGTESDNLAVIGTALANKDKGRHIITTGQEHHAVLHAMAYLEKRGFEVTYLPPSEQGLINVSDLKEALRDDTILVSIMYVNNETGVIQPISEIGDLLKDHQALFHTDAVQAMGLLPVNVKEMNIDLLSASGHKINGPKGSGFLYVKESIQLQALLFGGEQERKRRSGTENLSQIIGLAKALQLAMENKEENKRLYGGLKEAFIKRLEESKLDFQINGDEGNLVSTIVNISFPNTEVEKMLTNLDLEGVAASSGSACTAGSIEPSHVLVALYGEEDPRVYNSIRFSFGYGQTEDLMVEAAERIIKIVNRLKK